MEVKYNNYNDGHVVANTSSLITKADLFNVGSHDYTQYIYVNQNLKIVIHTLNNPRVPRRCK